MGPPTRKGIPWVILLSHLHDVGLPEVYLSIHIKPIARSISSESDAEIAGAFTGSASGSVYTRYIEYHQNIISKDQYTNWKLNWPNSCDSTKDGHVDWKNI